MGDRIRALTVALESDVASEDCERLVEAIRLIRGVRGVTMHPANIADYVAEERARYEWQKKFHDLLFPPTKEGGS